MAFTETTFSASVSTTELSVTGGSSTIQTQTTDGYVSLVLDLNALGVGDIFEVRGYEKVTSSATQRVFFYSTVSTQGVADAALWYTPAYPVMHGWDWTIKKVSGTDRTIAGSVRLLPV